MGSLSDMKRQENVYFPARQCKTFFLDATMEFKPAFAKLEKEVNEFCFTLDGDDVQIIPLKSMVSMLVPMSGAGVIGSRGAEFAPATSLHFSFTVVWTPRGPVTK